MADNERDRRRFAEYVQLQAGERGFLSRADEKTLLQDGMTRFQIDYDEARWILTGVAAEHETALERELDRTIAAVLGRFAETNNKITKAEFEDAVQIYRRLTRDALSEDATKSKIKAIIVERDWRPARTGWMRSRRWFSKVKQAG
jgi:hypothetical protein